MKAKLKELIIAMLVVTGFCVFMWGMFFAFPGLFPQQ